MAGFGSDTFGSSPYGIGTPAVAERLGGKLLQNEQTGAIEGSRLIDPATRDYVMGETGRFLGMGNVHQLVQLAVSTEKGSAAARKLGHELRKIERITANVVARVTSTLTAAVQHIVDRGWMVVLGVTVEVVRPGVVRTRLKWRDLTSTDDDQETESTFGG